MAELTDIERLFAVARPPRAGSTTWYDACDLLATEVKARLRRRFGRGFLVEIYGDEVGLILRVRGDGYGAKPWSVDRALDPRSPLAPQVSQVLPDVEERVRANYVQAATTRKVVKGTVKPVPVKERKRAVRAKRS